MTLDELQLVGRAQMAAEDLLAAFPDVVFTSGRRTLEEQAQAMASNIIFNRFWVPQTYTDSLASRACHRWVLAHPSVRDKDGISAGLFGVLSVIPLEDLSHLSLHLSGQAFDVEPVGGIDGGKIAAFMHELADKYGGVFLEREGGLVRWHFQVRDHA